MGLKPATALCLALVAGLAAASEQQLVGKPVLLPASTYVGAEMYEPRLAPNGRRLLFLRDADAATEVVVLNLETSKGSVVATVRHGKHVLNSCDWATDDRLVCSTMWSYGLKANRKSHEGYSFRSNTRLFAIDRDGGNFLELVPPPTKLPTFPGVGKKIGGIIDHHRPRDERKHDILSLLPDDPDHVLVEMVRGYLFSVGVWKLKIRNNTLDPIVPPIAFARYWAPTGEGGCGSARGRITARPRSGELAASTSKTAATASERWRPRRHRSSVHLGCCPKCSAIPMTARAPMWRPTTAIPVGSSSCKWIHARSRCRNELRISRTAMPPPSPCRERTAA